MIALRLALVLACMLAVGCGSTKGELLGPAAGGTASSASSTPDALAACERAPAAGLASSGTLAGAFTIRAEDAAEEDETRGGPNGPHPLRSEFRDYPPDAAITLCFFDGFIAAPGGPPPEPPATWRPYDRYVVLVGPSGAARLLAAGHHETLPVQPRLP